MNSSIIYNILQYAEKHGLDIREYPGNAEPGYADLPVLAADWNELRLAKIERTLCNKLEQEGICTCEWSDEWESCSDCGKAFRTSPTSYDWQCSGLWASDCEMVCRECWESNIDDIIETYKSDRHGFSNKALPSDIIPLLKAERFTCMYDHPKNYEQCPIYETGFHPGQTDDPEKVFQSIMEDSKQWTVLFVINESSQFYARWSAWVRMEGE